jgi:RimJ/RimL family protein N-acetyltransferase
MRIRKAAETDAQQIMQVMKDAEKSGFMLFDPGERQMDSDSLSSFIVKTNSTEKSAVFIAEDEKRILGYLLLRGEKPNRISHRAYIVIGVLSSSRGQGVGKALFSHAIDWAEKEGIHRLELTVLLENKTALALYQKMGFEIEGIKRDSLKIDGKYADEYYMSLLL